jgi:hypothetical protein
VPVPLAGWGVDGVARADLDDRAATRLDEAVSLDDVQGLADGVAVPAVAGAGGEPNDADAHAGGLLAPHDDVVRLRCVDRGRSLRHASAPCG